MVLVVFWLLPASTNENPPSGKLVEKKVPSLPTFKIPRSTSDDGFSLFISIKCYRETGVGGYKLYMLMLMNMNSLSQQSLPSVVSAVSEHPSPQVVLQEILVLVSISWKLGRQAIHVISRNIFFSMSSQPQNYRSSIKLYKEMSMLTNTSTVWSPSDRML